MLFLGLVLAGTTSYSKAGSFTSYVDRTIRPFKKMIAENYGEEALEDPRIVDYIRSLEWEGKTQGQKALLGSIDSPIVSTEAIEGIVGYTMDHGKLSTSDVDYYAREMGELLGKLPSNRSAEIAAHAAMTSESMLPALSNDASSAAFAVIESARSGTADIAAEITSNVVRPVMISRSEPLAGAAVASASRSSTTSRIISGVQTAMKVVGRIK